MTDATLNYDQVLSLSPPESQRITTTISPSNGGPYRKNDKISIDIPATAFMNPHSSYIQFVYTPTVTVGATPLPAASSYLILDGGATSVFNRAALYVGQGGAEISSLSEFDFVAQSLIRRKGKLFTEQVATNAMGSHPLITEWTGNGVDTDEYFLLAQRSAIPAHAVQTGGVVAAGTVQTGTPVRFAVPLSMFSGLFDIKNKLALMYMGTSTVLRLELTVNDANRALYLASSVAPGAAVAASTFGFNLSQVELQMNVSNVGQETMDRVKALIMGNGVHLKYTNVTSTTDTWSSGSSFTHKHAKSLLSLNQMAIQLRDSTKLNDITYPSVSATRKFSLNELQVSIGASNFPQHPLQFGEGFSGNVYLENYLANDNKDKSVYGGSDAYYVSSYNSSSKNGFEVALNFSSEHDKDSSIFSGKDLRSGSNTINTKIRRDDTTPASIHICVVYFAAQTLAILANGVVPPNLG